MTNALYPKWKQSLLQGDSNADLNTNPVKCALIDRTKYTYVASHQYYTEIAAAVIGTPAALNNRGFTDGKFTCEPGVLFTSVSGAPIEALVFFIDTGNPSTSRLVFYEDADVQTFPTVPNGGDITVVINALGVFWL